MKVIGMRKFEYTSKRTGNKYKAANLYCSYDAADTIGVRCESVFLSSDKVPPDLKLGNEINVLYNRFGNVEAIEVVNNV